MAPESWLTWMLSTVRMWLATICRSLYRILILITMWRRVTCCLWGVPIPGNGLGLVVWRWARDLLLMRMQFQILARVRFCDLVVVAIHVRSKILILHSLLHRGLSFEPSEYIWSILYRRSRLETTWCALYRISKYVQWSFKKASVCISQKDVTVAIFYKLIQK